VIERTFGSGLCRLRTASDERLTAERQRHRDAGGE
jgi:hypothetical protein